MALKKSKKVISFQTRRLTKLISRYQIERNKNLKRKSLKLRNKRFAEISSILKIENGLKEHFSEKAFWFLEFVKIQRDIKKKPKDSFDHIDSFEIFKTEEENEKKPKFETHSETFRLVDSLHFCNLVIDMFSELLNWPELEYICKRQFPRFQNFSKILEFVDRSSEADGLLSPTGEGLVEFVPNSKMLLGLRADAGLSRILSGERSSKSYFRGDSWAEVEEVKIENVWSNPDFDDSSEVSDSKDGNQSRNRSRIFTNSTARSFQKIPESEPSRNQRPEYQNIANRDSLQGQIAKYSKSSKFPNLHDPHLPPLVKHQTEQAKPTPFLEFREEMTQHEADEVFTERSLNNIELLAVLIFSKLILFLHRIWLKRHLLEDSEADWVWKIFSKFERCRLLCKLVEGCLDSVSLKRLEKEVLLVTSPENEQGKLVQCELKGVVGLLLKRMLNARHYIDDFQLVA